MTFGTLEHFLGTKKRERKKAMTKGGTCFIKRYVIQMHHKRCPVEGQHRRKEWVIKFIFPRPGINFTFFIALKTLEITEQNIVNVMIHY